MPDSEPEPAPAPKPDDAKSEEPEPGIVAKLLGKIFTLARRSATGGDYD